MVATPYNDDGDAETCGYDYGVDGGGTVWLANSVQRSDFNSKDEKSWQAALRSGLRRLRRPRV